MNALALDLGQYDIPQRNDIAESTIDKYANLLATTDAAIRNVNSIFLPLHFSSPRKVIAACMRTFVALGRDLARIYEAPHDAIVRTIQNSTNGPEFDATVELDVEEMFGSNFIAINASQFVTEQIVKGAIAGTIPVIGGAVSNNINSKSMLTMTWRVGVMVSIYYQNGARWINDREDTFDRAKLMIPDPPVPVQNRNILDSIPEKIPEVCAYQVAQLMMFVDTLYELSPTISELVIRRVLKERGVKETLLDSTIKKIRRKKEKTAEHA